jgi:hypothetical protein
MLVLLVGAELFRADGQTDRCSSNITLRTHLKDQEGELLSLIPATSADDYAPRHTL